LKLNFKLRKAPAYTHEGGRAFRSTPENELRRAVCTCLLWEDSFYESGQSIAERIAVLIPNVAPEFVAQLAVEARTIHNLRHAPLLIVREMAKLPTHKHLVADTLERVIQRPDELGEFISIYWKDGKQPLSNQVKKGLRNAFLKFNDYSLAKYNSANAAIKLRDVAFLTHVKPQNSEQALRLARLVNKEHFSEKYPFDQPFLHLPVPDTWETELSAGKDKRETWERLLREKKLGALAFLRNLRNMQQVDVDRDLILDYAMDLDVSRVLPFRFIAAQRYAPDLTLRLEKLMLNSIKELPKLEGTTVILVDVSGSMNAALSGKSDLSRFDAATALAMICTEICHDAIVYAFGTNYAKVPSVRGFGLKIVLADEMKRIGGATYLQLAIDGICASEKFDRLIVITDEQAQDTRANPFHVNTKKAAVFYVINVAGFKNGVSYDKNVIHIDGFSESVIQFIYEFEKLSEM